MLKLPQGFHLSNSFTGWKPPVECEIPSLKIVIHVLPNMTELEECLLHLEHLDEKCRDALTTNKAHNKSI